MLQKDTCGITKEAKTSFGQIFFEDFRIDEPGENDFDAITIGVVGIACLVKSYSWFSRNVLAKSEECNIFEIRNSNLVVLQSQLTTKLRVPKTILAN
ncbi:hypothetical protein [Draconibacterium orientale]|uniref:hypothetical protein n=1 Tax=Draconibacterium orientale TaxID=1168034 RepID=UPI002ABDED29|nr:hypothetical protein [Draconibacterium orientale]